MKKLLLTSALALLLAPPPGATAQETTEALQFALNDSYNCDVLTGIGTPISFTRGYAEYYLAKDMDVTNVKVLKVTCSRAKDVSLKVTVTDNGFASTASEIAIEANKTNNIQLTDYTSGTYTVSIKESTGGTGTDDGTGKPASGYVTVDDLTVKDTFGDENVITTFVGSNWGGTAIGGQKKGSITYSGRYGHVDFVDSKGDALTYNPATDGNWTLDVEFASAVTGDLYWEFKKGTASKDFYGQKHILPGDKTATMTIAPQDVDGTLSSLYLKAEKVDESKYPFTITIKSIKLTKSPAALRPVTTQADLLSTEYYTLTGVRSSTPHPGLNIVRRTYSDGFVVTEKTLIR